MATEQYLATSDVTFMHRCVAVAHAGLGKGEYPFAAVISRRGQFVCEAYNLVRTEGDVTRHAEMIALSEAQKKLRSSSLEDCTLYSTVEPCAMCSYAIRETRVGRVISGLRSPVMGGYSRWDILADRQLSVTVPEVFTTPPEIQLGCLHDQIQEVFRDQHPLVWQVQARKIFVAGAGPEIVKTKSEGGLKWRLIRWARTVIIDKFWRD
jgi:tRNA(adenine34) deaminase